MATMSATTKLGKVSSKKVIPSYNIEEEDYMLCIMANPNGFLMEDFVIMQKKKGL